MPNHQGTEGAQGCSLSLSPSLPLFHYSPRPDGRDPGPCCVRLRVAPPPPLARLTSLKGRSLASPFDCFLHLSARLSWGPVWSGRSLWKLSDVWHPLRWGAVYQLWLSKGNTAWVCEGTVPLQTLNNTSRFISGCQNFLQNCLFICNTKSRWSAASCFPVCTLLGCCRWDVMAGTTTK